MGFVADIAHAVAAHGRPVQFVQGSSTRGNGSAWAYGNDALGVINHHTAGARSVQVDNILIYGRSDLSGPLCNYSIGHTGILYVIAEHPANHAGASGGWDTAPMEVTNDFNRCVAGVEVQYPGNEPMSDAQWATLAVLNFCAMERMGHSGDYRWIKNHNGTSVQGKWDMGYAPGKTIDINEVRRAAQAVGAKPAPSPAHPEDDEMTQAQYDQLRKDIGFARDQIRGDLAAIRAEVAKIPAAVLWTDVKSAKKTADGKDRPAKLGSFLQWSDLQVDRDQKNVEQQADRIIAEVDKVAAKVAPAPEPAKPA